MKYFRTYKAIRFDRENQNFDYPNRYIVNLLELLAEDVEKDKYVSR